MKLGVGHLNLKAGQQNRKKEEQPQGRKISFNYVPNGNEAILSPENEKDIDYSRLLAS